MKKIFNNLLASFDNKDGGFSGKKLSAVFVMLCIIAAHAKWIAMGDFKQLEMVLTIDYTFICTMFGINVADKKINNNPTPPTNTEQPLN
jgi:hypothetical protein